jgi:rod shape-determining protein MreC
MNLSVNKTKSLSVFLLFIILSFVVVVYQSKSVETGKTNLGESIFISGILPLQKLVNNITDRFLFLSLYFKSLKSLHEDNLKLEKEIEKLNKENQTLKELSEENKILKELLEFREEKNYDLIAASLIGREPNSWFQSIMIDKGSKKGFRKNMIVLNNYGLIGRILVVSSYTSKVMLITDVENAVPAVVMDTRDAGIIYGTGYTCEMKYISVNAKIKAGYTVISSGLGDIYPGGIPIGKIVKIYPSYDKLFQTAEIEPFVNFGTLETVMVMRNSE